MDSRRTLGLVAGGGQFPVMVAQSAREKGVKVSVVAFDRETSPEIQNWAEDLIWIKLGQLGKMIRYLKEQNAREVVFAGPINKPGAFDIRPDLRAIRLLLSLKSRNDNSLLSAVAAELSSEGMEVVSALKYVPELVSAPGCMTRRKPSRQEQEDILFGWPLIKQIGAMDIGQCIVIRERAVVAVEAVEGTDAAIVRAGGLVGPGCCVIKTFKPGQDQRIDLPALGAGTIETMARARASCLAYEAGSSLFFDREKAISTADRHKIAVLGIDPAEDIALQLENV